MDLCSRDVLSVTINGKEIHDSQVCVDFLGGKFQKNFISRLSPIEQSTARAYQVMCEEHLYRQVHVL